MMLLGVFAALPTAAAGLADFSAIPESSFSKALGFKHMVLNTFSLFGFCAQLLFLRSDGVGIAWTTALLNMLQIAFLGISGYLGHVMVLQRRVHEERSERVDVQGRGGGVPFKYTRPLVEQDGADTIGRRTAIAS
eukprot:TRINITY_DN4869_c0_g1_i6.p7 TRINITY_DN4869_c0_g1~~TRINITY_DN4869_c0_g1_i6.p7  ORF type:complete len:135 (-),score=37.68 TRINITY_DN4869_c0_g1_i6:2855-3259(-)